MSMIYNSSLFSLRALKGFTNYISEEGAAKLKAYKYSGGDTGYLYTYFYNPVAMKLVAFLPESLA